MVRGAWGAQLVEHLTLVCGSGHDCRLMGLSTVLGSVLSAKSAWDSLPPPLPLPLLMHMLSLNK